MGTKVSFKQLFLIMSFITIAEIIQVWYDQPVGLALLHIFVLFLYCLICSRLGFVFYASFSAFVYESFETSAWFSTRGNLTFQVFQAIDFRFLITTEPILLFLGILATVVVTAASYAIAKYIAGWEIQISSRGMTVLSLMFCVAFFSFFVVLLHSFKPFKDMFFMRSEFTERQKRILNQFTAKPTITKLPDKLRNLVVIQLESVDRGEIGYYNDLYSEITPFLSNAVANGTVVSNITMQRYATCTAAATFMSQCSFPHLVGTGLQTESHITRWKVPCISTYLKLAGYDLYAYAVGSTQIMGIKQFFQNRGFLMKDRDDHHGDLDWDVIDVVIKDLPGIIQKGKPFYLRILTEDTHGPRFYVDSRCSGRGLKPEKSYQRIAKSVNCVDEIVERLANKMREFGLNETNTLFVLHPDHHSFFGSIDGMRGKYLFVVFPWEKKQEIVKEATYYDIAPSLLELLDIQYQPEFAFGTSFFSPEPGYHPEGEEFSFMEHIKIRRDRGIQK